MSFREIKNLLKLNMLYVYEYAYALSKYCSINICKHDKVTSVFQKTNFELEHDLRRSVDLFSAKINI